VEGGKTYREMRVALRLCFSTAQLLQRDHVCVREQGAGLIGGNAR
jgi:hypothetical protein